MKKGYRYLFIGVWLIFATASLALWWLKNPDMYPTFPTPFWEWLGQLYGATCCEEQADLELLVRLSLSLLVVSLLTFIVLVLWRRIQSALTPGSRRRRR
jgi:hypothetical protein